MLQASGIVLSEDQIKETFFIIAGDVKMTFDGKVIEMKPGSRVTPLPGSDVASP